MPQDTPDTDSSSREGIEHSEWRPISVKGNQRESKAAKPNASATGLPTRQPIGMIGSCRGVRATSTATELIAKSRSQSLEVDPDGLQGHPSKMQGPKVDEFTQPSTTVHRGG